jgi:hypothetical protein
VSVHTEGFDEPITNAILKYVTSARTSWPNVTSGPFLHRGAGFTLVQDLHRFFNPTDAR